MLNILNLFSPLSETQRPLSATEIFTNLSSSLSVTPWWELSLPGTRSLDLNDSDNWLYSLPTGNTDVWSQTLFGWSHGSTIKYLLFNSLYILIRVWWEKKPFYLQIELKFNRPGICKCFMSQSWLVNQAKFR